MYKINTSCEHELRMFSDELSTLSDELDERVVHGCLLAGATVERSVPFIRPAGSMAQPSMCADRAALAPSITSQRGFGSSSANRRQ